MDIEKDIRLKTKPMGFDKKSVMDFIEQLQIENENLKRENSELVAKQNALLKENTMLRTRIDVFAEGVQKAAQKASGVSPINDVQKLIDEQSEGEEPAENPVENPVEDQKDQLIEVSDDSDENSDEAKDEVKDEDKDENEEEYKITFEDLSDAQPQSELPYAEALEAIKEKDETVVLESVNTATSKVTPKSKPSHKPSGKKFVVSSKSKNKVSVKPKKR